MSLEKDILKVRQNAELTESSMDQVFYEHVEEFERLVLRPFCDRHNLRFASAMGAYGFLTPTGKRLEDPRYMIDRHERVTNQIEFFNDPVYRDRGPQRCRSTEWRNYEPAFHASYRSVWELLEQKFGNQYVVAFATNDYNSPGYEKNLKKIEARTE